MDGHIEQEGVLPHIFTVAEEMVDEDEMAAGADGEEFGEALDDGKDEDREECHGFSVCMLYYYFLALRLSGGKAMGSYHFISKSFHWVVALMMVGLLALGYYMSGLEGSPFKYGLYGWHKSFGILVLALAVLRLSWRFYQGAPEGLGTHQRWEKILSKVTHVVLYLAIFAMPLSGWLMSSAGGHGVKFFGLFKMPDLIAKNKALGGVFNQTHEILGYVILAAMILHLAGALKHHFIDADETIKRMTWARFGTVQGVLSGLFFGAVLGYCALQVVLKFL